MMKIRNMKKTGKFQSERLTRRTAICLLYGKIYAMIKLGEHINFEKGRAKI